MKVKMKKLVTGIIALCLLAGVVPGAVYAKGVTSIINLINLTIDEPEVGKAPSENAELPEKASTRVLSVSWSPDDAVFKANTDYTVTVRVGIKPDQKNKAFNSSTEKMTVKVNKVKTTDITKSGDDVIVKYTWSSAAKTSEKTADTKTGFFDVPDGAYYAAAVTWAVEKKSPPARARRLSLRITPAHAHRY